MWCSPRLSNRTFIFLTYVNDLKDASKSLDCIIFADDTNLIYSHKNIKCLFYTVNSELDKISQWFKANKLLINNDIPVKLHALMVDSNNIKRTSLINFLGVMLDKHISRIDHVRTVDNKIAKNIGLLYRVSQFLNEDSLYISRIFIPI